LKTTLFDTSKPRTKREAIDILDQLRAAGLPDPVPEFQFAKQYGRKWAFDWSWPSYRLALEIEGALFGGRVIHVGTGAFEYRTIHGEKKHLPVQGIVRLGGGHNSGERLKRDLEKRNFAAVLGWSVLYVMPDDVKNQSVVALVQQAFTARGIKIYERTSDGEPQPAGATRTQRRPW